jgi:hypothetical protein
MGHVPWRTVKLPEGRFGLNFRKPNDEKWEINPSQFSETLKW